MVASGNLIAGFRRNEMQKLEEMLSNFTTTQPRVAGIPEDTQGAEWQQQPADSAAAVQEPVPPPPFPEFTKDSSSQAEDLTAQQIIDVVNSMEWEDNEWMSFTAMDDQA